MEDGLLLILSVLLKVVRVHGDGNIMIKKCHEKGLSGKALDIFAQEILTDTSINWQSIEQKYNYVYDKQHAIPA